MLKVRSVTAALVAATVACCLIPPAHARTAEYVALGDSFAAGPFIPGQTGSPLGCLRSDRNYPSLVAAAQHARLTDVTCSGARTTHMAGPQITPAGTNPPQLEALTKDTDLVTLSIGGNDMGFGEVSLTCGLASLTNPSGAPCAAKYGDTLTRRIAETAPKVAAVLKAIHTRAPKARVLIVGYLRLLPEGPGCWPVVPIAHGDVPFLNRVERGLLDMLAEQARTHRAEFVDTYEDGHDMCAPAGRRWVEGIFLAAPAAPFHPNAAGMQAVASRVLRRPPTDVLAR